MVVYYSPIDPHIHFRGTEYPRDNFLALGFRDAHAVGLIAVGEQPNPNPVLTSPEAVEARLHHASAYTHDEKEHEIYHWIHIGMTNEMQQNKRSLQAVMQGIHRLRSDKTFNTHSTGDMGILEAENRKSIYQIKGDILYTGVSCTHCENDRLYTTPFDYREPITHSIRQNETSELGSVEETLRNSKDAKFKGKVYICHASSPETIDFINRERRSMPFNIIIEATWHHMFLNIKDYLLHGNLVKMNPPLRRKNSQERVLERVLRGEIDVIGSDHAPHPLELKHSNTPPSGIPALPFWPKGIELLRTYGIQEKILENITFHNSNRIFHLNLTPHQVDIAYQPQLWEAYGWNPFSRVDETQ